MPTYVEQGYVAIWASWQVGFLGASVNDKKVLGRWEHPGLSNRLGGPASNITTRGLTGASEVRKFSLASTAGDEVYRIRHTRHPPNRYFAQTQAIPARQDAVVAAEKVLQNGSDVVKNREGHAPGPAANNARDHR